MSMVAHAFGFRAWTEYFTDRIADTKQRAMDGVALLVAQDAADRHRPRLLEADHLLASLAVATIVFLAVSAGAQLAFGRSVGLHLLLEY